VQEALVVLAARHSSRALARALLPLLHALLLLLVVVLLLVLARHSRLLVPEL
jgi:hypothetical protein